MTNTISISRVRLLTTGVDGGHCYVIGLCVWDGKVVPVHAFMLDRQEERRLVEQHDGTASLAYGRHSYIQGIGLSLWDCRVLSQDTANNATSVDGEALTMNATRKQETSQPNVSLRPFDLTDLDALCEAIAESAPELRTWMAWFHDDYGRDDARVWLAGREAAWDTAQSWDFAVVGEGGQLLGSCGLHHIDLFHRFAELGYWVRTGATGKGVGTAAARQLCEWAFREQRIRRIEIVAARENVASRRVASKVGAVREGLMRQRLVIRDQLHDAVVYGLLRDELKLE